MVVTAGHARLLRGDAVPVRVIDLSRAGGPARPASGAASGAKPGAASGAAGKGA
jgi:membrane fusion protein (multidrug efflux system)